MASQRIPFVERKALVRRCASTNTDIELAYHTFGDPANPCVLLVSGLGVQCLMYDEELCDYVARHGFYVVRYDNRDVGFSTKLDHVKQPKLLNVLLPPACVPNGAVPYSLDDMALDGIALLDVLRIPAAHIVGTSMGGMIVQIMATKHTARVLSMTSIVSLTGSKTHGVEPSFGMKLLMLKGPRSSSKEDLVALRILKLTAIGGPTAAAHRQWIETRSWEVVNRTAYNKGAFRQMVAIVTAADREPLLRQCPVPALIIHGNEDPLVPVGNGYRTAAVMPNANLVLVEGMGHILFPPAFDYVAGLIVAHAKRADGAKPKSD